MKQFKLFCLFSVFQLVLMTVVFAQVDTAWVRRYNGPGNLFDRRVLLQLIIKEMFM